MQIEELVVELSKDPFNPELNFACAQEYDRLGQTASAVSFYLRTAEYGYETHRKLAYQSLLRTSICFENQNDRKHTVSNCILQAVELCPNEVEGYFLMARFHERNGEWQEAYTWSGMGLEISDSNKERSYSNTFLDYEGEYSLLFERAVCGWWVGRVEEAKDTFHRMLAMDIKENYRSAIVDNLKRIDPNAGL